MAPAPNVPKKTRAKRSNVVPAPNVSISTSKRPFRESDDDSSQDDEEVDEFDDISIPPDARIRLDDVHLDEFAPVEDNQVIGDFDQVWV